MDMEMLTGEIYLGHIMGNLFPMMPLEIRLMMEPGPIPGRKAVSLQQCLRVVPPGHSFMMPMVCEASEPLEAWFTIIPIMAVS